jgi:hypothetical protein
MSTALLATNAVLAALLLRKTMHRISQREIEAIITAKLRERLPALGAVKLVRSPKGWRCRIARVGRAAAPFPEADLMLADLLKDHIIVDMDGREDEGKLRSE